MTSGKTNVTTEKSNWTVYWIVIFSILALFTIALVVGAIYGQSHVSPNFVVQPKIVNYPVCTTALVIHAFADNGLPSNDPKHKSLTIDIDSAGTVTTTTMTGNNVQANPQPNKLSSGACANKTSVPGGKVQSIVQDIITDDDFMNMTNDLSFPSATDAVQPMRQLTVNLDKPFTIITFHNPDTRNNGAFEKYWGRIMTETGGQWNP